MNTLTSWLFFFFWFVRDAAPLSLGDDVFEEEWVRSLFLNSLVIESVSWLAFFSIIAGSGWTERSRRARLGPPSIWCILWVAGGPWNFANSSAVKYESLNSPYSTLCSTLILSFKVVGEKSTLSLKKIWLGGTTLSLSKKVGSWVVRSVWLLLFLSYEICSSSFFS